MGKFILYDENYKKINEFNNKFVDGGKQFTLDMLFNSTMWLDSAWYGERYIGVGRSTDTNAGVTGPTDSVPVSTTGIWHNVSDSDYKLSNEITGTHRAILQAYRTGNTVNMYAIISDDNVDHTTESSIDIYEYGVFVTSGYTTANNPTDVNANATDKANVMIIRAVSTVTQDGEIYAKPYPKVEGKNCIIQYTFADFEG